MAPQGIYFFIINFSLFSLIGRGGGNPCPNFDKFGGHRAKYWGLPHQFTGVAALNLGVAGLIMGVTALIMGVAELIGVSALLLGVAALILCSWTHPTHSTKFLSSTIYCKMLTYLISFLFSINF